jgi:hypothetical protein
VRAIHGAAAAPAAPMAAPLSRFLRVIDWPDTVGLNDSVGFDIRLLDA